ncbi:hypothetical protein HRbin23_01547 [bacterium HR23]|nr:hypothetical protein HRbin23_01547 [bacterium HR23]
MLVQESNGGAQETLLEAGHHLNAREVALVDGAVETLAGEGFLGDAPIGTAVKEAPDALQFVDAFGGLLDQYPGQFLVIEPGPPFEGVQEVGL